MRVSWSCFVRGALGKELRRQEGRPNPVSQWSLLKGVPGVSCGRTAIYLTSGKPPPPPPFCNWMCASLRSCPPPLEMVKTVAR